MKKILIISTKSITLNLFLKELYIKFKSNNYITYVACSDIKNLDIIFQNKMEIKYPFLKFSDIFNIFNFIKNSFSFYFFLKKHKDFIILVNTPLTSHLVRIFNLFLNLKIIYFVHGFRFHKKEKKIKYYINYLIEKLLVTSTYSYITINNEDYQIINNYFKKKCIIINGVGTNINTVNKIKYFDNKNLIIGVLAAYRRNKGYDKLIKIANKLNQNKNIFFECFGYDSYHKYRNKAQTLNLQNIKFNKFTNNIYYQINKFDILLHLSEREGLSVAVIDSLKHSVPVIGYDIRGVNDLIINEYNGYLFKLGETDKIIIKINELFSKRELLKNLSKNANTSIDQSYSNDFINNRIYTFINEK